jgi:hypothetical protein
MSVSQEEVRILDDQSNSPPNFKLLGGLLFAEDSFAFKIIEDTYHGTPTHNVDNCFNNGHNA